MRHEIRHELVASWKDDKGAWWSTQPQVAETTPADWRRRGDTPGPVMLEARGLAAKLRPLHGAEVVVDVLEVLVEVDGERVRRIGVSKVGQA